MRHIAPFVFGLWLLVACSPSHNWREYRPDTVPLRMLFPCKPELYARQVPLGALRVQMHMASCEAAGATFALAWTEFEQPSEVAAGLAQWQTVTLGNMPGEAGAARPFVVKGSRVLPESVRIDKLGRQSDARALTFNGAWLAIDRWLVQASIHGPAQSAEVVETYFSGIVIP